MRNVNASLTEETKMRADMRGRTRGPAECDFAKPAGSSVLVTVRGAVSLRLAPS